MKQDNHEDQLQIHIAFTFTIQYLNSQQINSTLFEILTPASLNVSEESGMDTEEVWAWLRSKDSASSFVFSVAWRLIARVLCLGLGLGGSLAAPLSE